MTRFVCIVKFKNRNNIICNYRLQAENGEIMDIDPQSLKTAIASGQLDVINLILTSNNRLVDTMRNVPFKAQEIIIDETEQHTQDKDSVERFMKRHLEIQKKVKPKEIEITKNDIKNIDINKNLRFKDNTNIKNIEPKANLIGANITEVKEHLYAIETSEDITVVTDASKIRLREADKLFYFTEFKSIDLTNVDTSSVITLNGTFSYLKSKRINVSTLDVSNLKQMKNIFYHIELNELDLSNWRTPHLENMNGAFMMSVIKNLDIASLDTSNVTDMSDAFALSKIDKLDLRNFNTSKVLSTKEMFNKAMINELDLSSFDMSNVRNISDMFLKAEIKVLKLGQFNISEEAAINNIKNIFRFCKIQRLIFNSYSLKCKGIIVGPDTIGNWNEVSHLF